jgi:hypothetical protein
MKCDFCERETDDLVHIDTLDMYNIGEHKAICRNCLSFFKKSCYELRAKEAITKEVKDDKN